MSEWILKACSNAASTPLRRILECHGPKRSSRVYLSRALLTIAIFVSALPNAIAVDTDGDGLLDVLDLPDIELWKTESHPNLEDLSIQDLDGVNQLVKARTLILRNNLISSLEPGDFLELSHLEQLLLNGNRIASIQNGDLDGLTSMYRLSLGRNQITNIEQGAFQGPSELREIYLAGNAIANIEDGAFHGMAELTTLVLNGNGLTHLNFTDATFGKLIACNGSLLVLRGLCVETDLPVETGPKNRIRSLILDNAELTQSAFDAIIAETGSLQDVSLVGIQFSDVMPDDLRQLLNIATLDNVTVDTDFLNTYAAELNDFDSIAGNTVVVVPEPSSAWLYAWAALLSALAVAGRHWRHRCRRRDNSTSAAAP